jgi:hypothetical protein
MPRRRREDDSPVGHATVMESGRVEHLPSRGRSTLQATDGTRTRTSPCEEGALSFELQQVHNQYSSPTGPTAAATSAIASRAGHD